MEIDFVNLGPSEFDKYEEIFISLAKRTFEITRQKENYFVDVSIVDNLKIQEVNRDYRGIDRPTDVISFAFYDDKKEVIYDDAPNSLGMIVISFEKAIEQAKEYGHSLKREMSFLFVHGMLHLLGYDHMKKEDEVEMFALQDEILGGRFDD